MRRIGIIIALGLAVVSFSGCTGSATSSSADNNKVSSQKLGSGGVLRSADGGKTWEQKSAIDAKRNISSADVLSLAVDPKNGDTVYAGTAKSGIFVSRNGAESWEKVNLAADQVYGLAVSPADANVVYAAGLLKKRGKIFKTENGGTDWKEIYSEPADGTFVSVIQVNPVAANVLYAATNKGLVIKSTDHGTTWGQAYIAKGPITDIAFDADNDRVVHFAVFQQGVVRTKDGGKTFENLTLKTKDGKTMSTIYSVETDSRRGGAVYVGANQGLIRSADGGDSWEALHILSAPQSFPIRALAVNPVNSDEIVFSLAQVSYRSTDGGKKWATTQLNFDRVLQVIKYHPGDPGILYAGLRKAP